MSSSNALRKERGSLVFDQADGWCQNNGQFLGDESWKLKTQTLPRTSWLKNKCVPSLQYRLDNLQLPVLEISHLKVLQEQPRHLKVLYIYKIMSEDSISIYMAMILSRDLPYPGGVLRGCTCLTGFETKLRRVIL